MKMILTGVVTLAVVASLGWYFVVQTEKACPTTETFVQDFNDFSIELLAANPGYAEKEQRYYWQKHLEEMGCVESQDIINNAIDAGSTSDYE